MNTRVAGLIVAVVAVCGGVVTVGCAQSVSGRATVNETDRAAYVSAVAATSSSKAKAARGAVCASFVTSALQVQTKIDALVVALVKREHEKAVKLLNDHRSKLDELSKYLYEKETITGEEFMKILNLEKAQDKTQD